MDLCLFKQYALFLEKELNLSLVKEKKVKNISEENIIEYINFVKYSQKNSLIEIVLPHFNSLDENQFNILNNSLTEFLNNKLDEQLNLKKNNLILYQITVNDFRKKLLNNDIEISKNKIIEFEYLLNKINEYQFRATKSRVVA